MSGNKTRPTGKAVDDFIAAIDRDGRRQDAKLLDALFRRVTGEEPVMWGPSMIGYGKYHYKYDSGREGDWMRSGFSPRKAKHSLHLMGGYCDDIVGKRRDALLATLGKHSTGKSCLYINKLADVDMDVLEELVRADWEAMNRIYPPEG
ncbi:MAG: DUF1801 domain-containing protein [Alteraurantiacibacter sp.]